MDIFSKKAVFILICVFLGIASVIGFVVILRLANHQAVWLGNPATITVSGSSKVTYTPDIAIIRIAVIAKGKDPESVQEENNKNMQGVVAYLKQAGIASDDIQTTTYNLYPEYDYNERGADTSKIIGYTLHQSVVCKVRQDLTRVGNIIGGLTNAGANSIEGVEFSLSDTQKTKLESEAKTKAIADAESRLEHLRKGMRFRVLRMVNIQDTPSWPVDVFRSYSLKEVGGVGGGTPAPIEIGSGELVSNISITFEIK